jgi:hypothetical protein
MPYTPTGPFLVDVPGHSYWTHLRNWVGNFPGVHRRGSDIYGVWYKGLGEATTGIRVFRSTDGGATWASQDEASMPLGDFASVSSDRVGPDTVRIAYWTFSSHHVEVRDFDMATNTIGSVLIELDVDPWPIYFKGYDCNPVVNEDWIYATVRSDNAFAGTKLVLYRHDGSVFLAAVEVSDNVAAPTTKLCLLEGLFMDPAGTNHVLYSESLQGAPGNVPRTIYYRQIQSDGTMTAPVVVYTYTIPDSGGTNDATFGFAALAGNRLIWPFSKENGTDPSDVYFTPCTLVIDPYTNPAPVITQVDIPGQRLVPVGGYSDQGSIHAVALGAAAYLWWIEQGGADGVTPYMRIIYQPYNGVGVPGSGTIFHDEIANPTPWAGPGAILRWLSPPWMDAADPMLFVAVDIAGAFMGIGAGPAPSSLTVTKILAPPGDPGLFNLQIDGVTQAANQGNGGTTGPIAVAAGVHQVGETAGIGTNLADYTTVYGGAAAPDGSVVVGVGEDLVSTITNTLIPPPPPPAVVRGGEGYRRPVCKPPNRFDCCLMVDAEKARRVPKLRMCQMPEQKEGLKWVQAPPGSLLFRKTQAIPTPLAIAGDVPVLQFEVPTGYDGVIRGQFHRYTGPGFREGNGDLEWRVKINRVYAKHLGDVKVSIGQVGQPMPIRDGIPLSSQQRIQYIVAAPNLSGGILPVNSRIVCGLVGWFTPRR